MHCTQQNDLRQLLILSSLCLLLLFFMYNNISVLVVYAFLCLQVMLFTSLEYGRFFVDNRRCVLTFLVWPLYNDDIVLC